MTSASALAYDTLDNHSHPHIHPYTRTPFPDTAAAAAAVEDAHDAHPA
jgi:hypothetical protein